MVQVNFNTWGNNDFDWSRQIDKTQETFVIIHGYNNTGGKADPDPKKSKPAEIWMRDMAQALREQNSNANIIVVDWQDGANPDGGLLGEALEGAALGGTGGTLVAGLPGAAVGVVDGAVIGGLINYLKAANNTREVGRQIADQLTEWEIDPNKTTLIGHSLGAHVSGFAGAEYQQNEKNKTKPKINRIIGLDPAGPAFEIPSAENRLDPTDAEKVITLHTSKVLGHDDAIGSFSAFINWDDWSQPGKTIGVSIIGANHGYANELYTDLLKGNIFPQADGTRFDLNTLYSSPNGRADFDTTKVLFSGSTSGTLNNSGSNKFSLGTPSPTEGFVTFEGKPENGKFLTGENSLFSLGRITYQNGQTVFGSEPKGDFPLQIELKFSNPVEETQTFTFLLNNVVTLNETGDPVVDGDRLLFSEQISRERFKYQGKEYTVDLFGFSRDGGQNFVGQFDSPEDSIATAELFAKIVPVTFLVTNATEVGDTLKTKVFEETINRTIKNLLTDTKNAVLRGLYRVLKFGSIPVIAAENPDNLDSASQEFQITEAIAAENPGGIIGSDSNEKIIGSSVTDVVFSSGGTDNLEGMTGSDYLRGGQESDRIFGGADDDIINGNEGDDFISGGAGNDLVRGGKDNDQIFGDEGDDILIAERGIDRLTGGLGTDVFIFRTDTGEEKTDPATADWITDFNAAEGDIIAINGDVPKEIFTFTAADVNQDSISDTIIQYTENNDIIGLYTNIFGVVLSTAPDIVQNSLLSIPLNDPLIDEFG